MRPVADHNAAGAIRNSHFIQRVQDHFALIQRLAVQRYAGNDVNVLSKAEVIEDLLGVDRRLSSGNGDPHSGVFQIAQQLRNAWIHFVFKKTDGRKALTVIA